MPVLPRALFRQILLVVAVALLALTSCTFLRSGSTDRVTTTTLVAQPVAASPATVPHPDSLREGRTSDSYYQQQIEWSARHRTLMGDPRFASDVHTTFATLWSRELVEASLIYEMGIDNLSDDVAERIRAQELLQYQRLLRIRVHMFVDRRAPEAAFSTDLRPPRVDITLRGADGARRRPVRTLSGGVETYQQTSSSPVMFYRVNDLYFEREMDETDILDSEDLRLRVRYPANPLGDLYFEWEFAD